MPHPRTLLLALLLSAGGLAAAQIGSGNAFVDAGRFEEAIEAYEAAVEARPDDARARLLLARAHTYYAENLPPGNEDRQERHFALAEERALRAVEVAPENPDAHMELARALGRLAQFRGVFNALNLASRTQEALETAVELDPEHASAWHALALFHHEAPWIAGGRSGLIDPYFERAIEYEPDVITHRVDYAEVLVARERFDEAREQLDAAEALPVRTWQDRDAMAKADALRERLP